MTADESFDFFISYTASDELWAEWIAWELEAANYSVIIQKWDMRPGANFVSEMDRAARTADRTIAVLSPAYFASEFARAEWTAAYSAARTGELGKLVPVRVAECVPTGLLGLIVRIDVFGKSEDLARRMLLEGVNRSRAKPTSSPLFPGGSIASVAAPKSPPFPGDLPKCWTVPFRSNPYFQGRDSDLKCLFDAIGRTGAVVVHGLGGIGKTQLATQYAYSRASDYHAVLWISADKPESLRANFAALASPTVLGLTEHVEKQQDAQFEAVVGWLRNHRRWLLVLDGADTEDAWKAAIDLIEMLPAGHVIVTSRQSATPPRTIADHAVEKLSEAAAVKILLEQTQHDGQALGNQQEALAIVRELDGLPLALEQASAYLTREGVSFKVYLAGLKTTLADVLKRQTPGATRYPHSVFATWLVSEKELSAEAKAVLKLCSYLAPEPIPRTLFSSDERAFLAAVRQIEPACTTANIDAGLKQLADFSLVKLRADTVTCHPLLMFVQREGLDDTNRRAWLSLALQLVDKAAPPESDDVRTWPIWNSLRPHVVALVTNPEAHVVDGPAARLANDVTLMLLVKAEFEAAGPLLKRAREIAEARHGQDHPTFARSLGNEGVRLWQTGRMDEAEPLLRRALAIDERCLGAEHPDLATDLHILGRFLCETDAKQEGEPHLARALAIHETHYGLNHPKVAESCVALTTALLNTPRSAEAEPLLRRALAIFEKEPNAENPNVADVCNNLAVWLREEKRGPEAEALFRRALSIEERNYGADNPRLARMLMNLAVVLDEDHKYSEADSFRQRAFALIEQTYGAEHPRLAEYYNDVAMQMVLRNLPNDAEPLFRRALALREKAFGRDHAGNISYLVNLAELLGVVRKLDEAVSLQRRIVKLSEVHFGREHSDTAMRLYNLAYLLRETGAFSESAAILKRAVAIAEVNDGVDRESRAVWMFNLATVLEKIGEPQEAETLLKRVLWWRERVTGSGSQLDMANTIGKLAGLVEAREDFRAAEKLREREIELREKSSAPRDRYYTHAIYRLAGLVRRRGDAEETAALLQKLVSAYETLEGKDSEGVASALNEFGLFALERKKFAEAERAFGRALAIHRSRNGLDHPCVALQLYNLAITLRQAGRAREAEPLLHQARAIVKQSDSEHPDIVSVKAAWSKSGLKPLT